MGPARAGDSGRGQGGAAGFRMQRDRWKSNFAEAYRDPGVRVRKRLVTAAAKLRKLADTDLALEEVQKRRQKLVVRANAVGYQLTADDTVAEIAGVKVDSELANDNKPLSTERASKPWIGFLPALHYPSIYW